MTYQIIVRPDLEKKFRKIQKRNKEQLEQVLKKTEEISKNPHHYKNLKAPMNHLRRVHIDSHFVLIFSVNEKSKSITLEDFAHHDEAYQ